jgi:5-hydroxyisourate hydrolase
MSGVSPITTHVLDTAFGRPAAGLPITISILQEQDWSLLGNGVTNKDGRITDLLPSDKPLQPGTYKLRFDTSAYFGAAGVEGFYPFVEVTFVIRKNDQHYHVPLLLSPFGYSTYRGS